MTLPTMAVGIGNTTVRFALTDPGGCWPTKWCRQFELPVADFDAQRLVSLLPPNSLSWNIASVNRPTQRRLTDWVQQNRQADTLRLLEYNELPLQVRVPRPAAVGIDRLLAAVAVNRLRDQRHAAIVVDAGTAITVDWVESGGEFCGGAIFPGPRAMAGALASNTDLLPEIDFDFVKDQPALPADSTVTAIRAGIFLGSIGAVQHLIQQYRSLPQGKSAQLFLTGGDAPWLTDKLDIEHAMVPDLVLQGISLVAEN